MKTARLVLAGWILLALAVAPLTARAEAAYEQQQNVVFGEEHGVALAMDVFTPTGESNGLGIVDVASGGWSSDRGKIEDHRRAGMFDVFCGRGYTVFAVRPGSSSRFTVPDMVKHLKLAIRWIKAHHEQYGIDPDRLVMCGASAGGHLTCLTSVTPEDGNPEAKNPLDRHDTRVKAAVAFFPPTDFLNYGGRKLDLNSRNPIAQMAGRLLYPGGINGQSEDEVRTDLEKISPALLVTSDAPSFLLIHGDADLLVPLQQSRIMVEALEKAGVPVELIVKAGGGHPWPTIREEVVKAADWIDGQLTEAQVAVGGD